jgi:hypothetical protein
MVVAGLLSHHAACIMLAVSAMLAETKADIRRVEADAAQALQGGDFDDAYYLALQERLTALQEQKTLLLRKVLAGGGQVVREMHAGAAKCLRTYTAVSKHVWLGMHHQLQRQHLVPACVLVAGSAGHLHTCLLC